ncbi:putative orphan protein; putative EAL domain [Pseudoalteromonas luteoviolacea B = ATCC 29581]|nr:putative orphan protein; putative EAL domain [Pseudoalteromonas luteoviolacea B = ATCC 29581]
MLFLPFKYKPHIWLLIGLSLFISCLTGFVYHSYHKERNVIMTQIDERLLQAARSVPLIINANYHENLVNISEKEKIEVSQKLTKLAQTLKVTYVYTMVFEPPYVRLSASSFTEDDRKNGTLSEFNEIYLEATPANINAFSSTSPTFEISQDKWGKFKSVFVPFLTSNGQVYLAGADIAIEDLEAQLEKSTEHAAMTASFFFFLALLVSLLYFYVYVRNLEYDLSTNYPNRAALLKRLLSKQHLHWTVAVIWVKDLEDIIGFYGLEVAERVMENLLNYFNSRCSSGYVYRIATGKCALLLPNCNEAQSIDLIRSFPIYSPVINNPHVCIHLHAGIASGNAQMVLENAYVACRQAKQQNELLRVYSHENVSGKLDHKNHLALTNSIHKAIQSKHIQPYFEPRHLAHSGQITQLACSARIFNEFGQLLVAERIDPILLNSGLASQLAQIVLNLCMNRFRKETISWSMAVPYVAMHDPHFLDLLNDELRRYPTPQRITLEIDEQDLLRNYSVVAAFISQMKAKAVRIMIHNVSSGIITLTRVIRLDIDAILLAAPIATHVCTDEHVAHYVEHMAVQCQKANVKLGAKHVGSAEQFDKLCALGVNWLQGPFVGPASPQIPEPLLKFTHQPRAGLA